MKQLIVNREHLQTRVALVEDGKIQEYYIERHNDNRIVGSIFKGRIKNLEDSLHAAFVDIGLHKNAFLHYWDMIPPSEEELEDENPSSSSAAVDAAPVDEKTSDDDSEGDGRRRRNRRSRRSRSNRNSDESSSDNDTGSEGKDSEGRPSRNRRYRGRNNRSRNRDGRPGQQKDQDNQVQTTDDAPRRKDNPQPEPPKKDSFAARIKRIFLGNSAAAPPKEEPKKPSRDEDADNRKKPRERDDRRPNRSNRNRNRDDNRSDNRTKDSNKENESNSNDRGNRGNRRRNRPPSRPQVNIEDIPKKFKVGQEIIVQVTKGMIGDKGPRITTNLSIPGAYMVLMPNSSHKGVSKRIDDRRERARLKQIIHSFDLPSTMGCICRTAAIGQSEESLKMDLEVLLEKFQQAERTAAKRRAPICTYQEPTLVERNIRDFLSFGINEIIVDDEDSANLAANYAKRVSKETRPKIRLHKSPTPIFEYFGLADQIQKIFRRKIVLPSGSEIAIDETQALVSIDVDTARSKGKDHPDTILKTNLEAAEEVARQLRLRNIGGLVVIDFIDMRSKRDQMKVYNKFRECVSRDRAKTKVMPISKLGLMEMTRQREHESLQDAIFEPCFYCNGRGLVKSSISISVEIQRRLQELLRKNQGQTQVRVTVHPAVLQRLKSADAAILQAMEDQFGGDLSFRSDANIHQEEFHIMDVKTGKEIF